MDKEFLLRLENSLASIKKDLLLNENIRKLLYYDSNLEEGQSWDDLDIPPVEIVKNNIFLQPIVEVDNNPPFDKKMFISITSPSMAFENDNEAEYAVKISIMVDKTNWVYNENKIRVYHLAQEVVNSIDGVKYSIAGPLYFQQMLETILDKTITGKSLLFSTIDGVGDLSR